MTVYTYNVTKMEVNTTDDTGDNALLVESWGLGLTKNNYFVFFNGKSSGDLVPNPTVLVIKLSPEEAKVVEEELWAVCQDRHAPWPTVDRLYWIIKKWQKSTIS